MEEAGKNGVKFGIWVEPEMVNPKSELYERHPDWVLSLPNRDPHLYRSQLVLDLSNPEVQDFVFSVVDEIMTKNPDVAYIKWDCNRMLTNAWSPYLKADRQSHLPIAYVRGLYSVWERLRKKYPHLPMMLCAGGGGRVDYGSMKYFNELWPSDNTDALHRVYIQWGYSHFFPPFVLSAHVTSMGPQSLKFRTDVAMSGRLGFDIDTAEFSEKDFAFCRAAVENYRRLYDVIAHGDLYRLVSPYDEPRAVLMSVGKGADQAVVFAYTLQTGPHDRFPRVRLEGLDPKKNYRVEEINLEPGAKSRCPDNGKTFSGDYLMKVGLSASPSAPFTSSIYELNAVK